VGRQPRAFTLIELLMVVAIIAVLAAIAVPNFLEAQTRAKTSAVATSMRSVATSLEAYCVDNNHYPPEGDPFGRPDEYPRMDSDSSICLLVLTTPIAYMVGVQNLLDPFHRKNQRDSALLPAGREMTRHFYYVEYETFGPLRNRPPDATARAFGIASLGPNHEEDRILWGPQIELEKGGIAPPQSDFLEGGRVYDPTNGTNSTGDIARFGGMVPTQTEFYLQFSK
jgi:general secretion pathway protein G